MVSNDADYYYYINVCADITGFDTCKGMSVGQVSKTDQNPQCKAAGRNEGHELRYGIKLYFFKLWIQFKAIVVP